MVLIMGTKQTQLTGAADVIFGKTRLKVLALLFSRPEQSFYVREILRLLPAGQGAVQRELERLCEAGIIQRSRIGNQVHYKANRSCPIYEELKAIVIKTAGVADVLHRALAPLRDQVEFAFIYGSMAAGDSDGGSDVDLMVVGDAGFGQIVAQIQEAQLKLDREVNPRVYKADEFREKIKSDNGFLKRVMGSKKIFLIGDENEFGAMGQ